MRIAAYCRVSTDKNDQLNSLDAQKNFFVTYAKKTGDKLIKIYADEGISGTKIKNRIQFQQMMQDAELGLFEVLVVKDISRFARNTVDLLQGVRRLRELGIETQFLTANMTNMGNSEFVLTMFAALAQEESANTSKRVKFGKKINAEKGRVPNLIFGYDKTIGDYFNLTINKTESAIVQEIFKLYLNGLGCNKIAKHLNSKSIKTKRGCKWTQMAICRILNNKIYTGQVVNHKEEVDDFLTGKRSKKPSSEWLITHKPELQIVDNSTFESVQNLLKSREKSFNTEHTRHSNKHLFSTLIKCKECGFSFRRSVRKYKNTYIKWVCSKHNGQGADTCPNAVAIDEGELIAALEEYFACVLSQKKNTITHIVNEFTSRYKSSKNIARKKELTEALQKTESRRQKYLDMYADDLITREELNIKISNSKKEAEEIKQELSLVTGQALSEEKLKTILHCTFSDIKSFINLENATNEALKRIIEKIEVDKDGNVEIFLNALSGSYSTSADVLTLKDNSKENQNFIWLLK